MCGRLDDLQIGFTGSPKTKLDDRGRLKMPVEFKSFLEKKYGAAFNAFYITSREGKDAEIYPMPEWQKYQARIFSMPKGLPVRKKLLDSNALYGERVDMDPQGRVLMPEELRKSGHGQPGCEGFRRRHVVAREEPGRVCARA